MPFRTSSVISIIAIAAIAIISAGFMYLVTTFLFAFSGGQYRMVQVVNYGALAVVTLVVLAAAVTWRLRSASAAIKAAGVATAVGWIAAVIIAWLLSFWLGA